MNNNDQSFGLKVNLLSLPGATICPLQGNTAVKRCLIVPIDDAGLQETAKGVYLMLNASRRIEAIKGGWEYILRPNVPAEVYKSYTPAERNALPNLGVMRHLSPATPDSEQTTEGDVLTLSDNSYLSF